MKQLLYLLFFCSWAMVAQEQKYILLDSLTARYDTKKYTFSTLPYGSESTIELYNVFFKDYLLLISVLPDYERDIWQEMSFKSIQNNILSTKDLFKIEILENGIVAAISSIMAIVGSVFGMMFLIDSLRILGMLFSYTFIWWIPFLISSTFFVCYTIAPIVLKYGSSYNIRE